MISSQGTTKIINYSYKFIIYFIILFFCFYLTRKSVKSINNLNNENRREIIYNRNKIIEENFFVIDSNNLESVQSHMYGFSISKKGILTDNYYKSINYREFPEPEGTYIMIIKIGNKLRLIQDFFGCYGLYIYENKNENYFALSNSFLLLEEYLIGKQNISLNRDYADNFIISNLCTPSIHETLIKEIIKLPSNIYIIINTRKHSLKIHSIDYHENSIPLETEEGKKIIDKWVDKWGYIFRSLKKKTNNIYSDLSGGFDTRVLLSILINSGVNLNDIKISSIKDKLHNHEEDYKIATDISSKFGFELNRDILDHKSIKWSTEDSLFCSIYTKLGIHKEFNFKYMFFNKPRFRFTGCGGENLRGYPGFPISKYIKGILSPAKNFIGQDKFYYSSKKICNRSLELLKNENLYDEYELSSFLYKKGRTRNHYGKAAVEGFIANIFFLNPFMDSDIMKIKFDIGKNQHILISYILLRFAKSLINFPFERKRVIDSESLKNAERLENGVLPYQIKSDYNNKFFIDFKRVSPVPPSNENKSVDDFLKEVFKSSKFVQNINKIYDHKVYEWAKEYSRKNNFFSLRHGYGLLSISKTVEYLALNEIYLGK